MATKKYKAGAGMRSIEGEASVRKRRASWKPFLLIFLFSLAAAALTEKFAPEARSLPQAIQQLSNR